MSLERSVPEPVAGEATSEASPVPASPVAEWLQGTIAPREPQGAHSFLTGHLRGLDAEGRPLFQPEGSDEVVAVSIGVELSDGVIVKAIRRQRRAMVIRTADETPRWFLVGLVRERIGEKARDAKPGRLEVTVDGEKVKFEAEHDIELKCGQASLTLRYDGRIELRGTHILSASRGPNRVKGATIALN
jgi:hypothetical protein